MATVKSVWERTEENPNEGQLKKIWDSEVAALENAYSQEKQDVQRMEKNLEPLIKAGGFTTPQVTQLTNESRENSKKFFLDMDRQLITPPVNIEELHDADMRQMKMNAEQMTVQTATVWQGIIFNASYGGWCTAWNGEAEEVPNVTLNISQKRIDPRTQAWGEGLCDADFSQASAYLAFKFNPPSWGHLHVYVRPWVHGYYILHSNDTWYKQEYAAAKLNTWVDMYQNFWRGKQRIEQFNMAGDELNPQIAQRIDTQSIHNYSTQVGQGDTVTIRVGVDLYCRGRASGGRAQLNFQSGNANYVYVPHVHWVLHH